MLRFEVYEDRAGEWRWTLVANNGKTIADSGEGYVSEYNAMRAAARTKELAPQAPVKRPDGTTLREAKEVGYSADPF
ncbi:YegP family protein [Pseudoxanthomonas japonensis]|uniref:YegP family protein n=1 Tax=Pseudoxanthomonas japonensis TaxID=69284 RepID=UPI003749384D